MKVVMRSLLLHTRNLLNRTTLLVPPSVSAVLLEVVSIVAELALVA
jgi:hypothetical protein